MELLAAGLDRYWNELPPYDEEDENPRERFVARLGALGGLACSNFQTGRQRAASGGAAPCCSSRISTVRSLVPVEMARRWRSG